MIRCLQIRDSSSFSFKFPPRRKEIKNGLKNEAQFDKEKKKEKRNFAEKIIIRIWERDGKKERKFSNEIWIPTKKIETGICP